MPTFAYVTYLEAAAEQVWHALTDAGLTADYWGHSNVSDWRTGSRWEHQRTDSARTPDVVGTVLDSSPPTRLLLTWTAAGEAAPAEGPSRVAFDIRPHGGIVRLTVTHQNLADQAEYDAAAAGWPAVLSNLKTFLETGSPLPQEPWLVPQP
jgi:uncharacterized protein YndB with AHSA1/START domain